MREALEQLDREFAFHSSGRFDLLASEHIAYRSLGAQDVDDALRRAIERGEGPTTVAGRIGAGKSSLIASVTSELDEGFVPLRISVIGVDAGEPTAFARHAISEIRDLPDAALTKHESQALDRAQAEQRKDIRSRELRSGFRVAGGHVLKAGVVADLKKAAGEELTRTPDPSEVLRGMQRLLDVFWKLERCPVLIVEDTDHWGGAPELADRFFDQTVRAFTNLDAVMVIAAQTDYTERDGYRRIRDRLTDEVRLPALPEPRAALKVLLMRRIELAKVSVALGDVLDEDGVGLLSDAYLETAPAQDEAGDLRRTLALMRTALDIALSDPVAERVSAGHVQEALARIPPSSPSALRGLR